MCIIYVLILTYSFNMNPIHIKLIFEFTPIFYFFINFESNPKLNLCCKV